MNQNTSIKTSENPEPKIITIGCNGTWQTEKQKNPTNVSLLLDSIATENHNGTKQIVQHFDGVATSGNWLTRSFNGITGNDLIVKIKEAYKFLVLNYNEGDQIFKIGFSRGSFSSRTLNGMIYKCGIIDITKLKNEKDLDRKINEAYKFYKNKYSPGHKESRKFRQNNSLEHRPKTNLICFDTVGSLGVPKILSISALFNWRHNFHDTSLNRNTKFAFHGLSIDEVRKMFPPTPMELSHDANTIMHIKWFAGNHSATGGGSKDNINKPLSDIAALEAVRATEKYTDLRFDHEALARNFAPDNLANANDNFFQGGIWEYLGRHDRSISELGLIHMSAQDRYEKNNTYRPKELVKLL